MAKKDINVLHDHYKESFSHIRELEKSRDQSFLITILLIGALFLQVQYPSEFMGALGYMRIQNSEINLGSLPLAALLSLTWTFFLVFTLRYCQYSINVERQYKYLHKLEEKISAALGDEEIYIREGKAYLKNYPIFSSWVWFFYTILFPLIVISALLTLMRFELFGLPYPAFHKTYDVVIALGVALSFVFYRFVPLFKKNERQQSSNNCPFAEIKMTFFNFRPVECKRQMISRVIREYGFASLRVV